MPGLSGADDIVNEVSTNGKLDSWDFYKFTNSPSAITTTTGTWFSFWPCAGCPGPGAAVSGTPGDVLTNAAGSIEFPDRSTDLRFLSGLIAGCSSIGTLMVYDRLVQVGGPISLASTGNKTITSAALTRYTGTAAKNVSCWVEIVTATTVTAVVMSMNSYTNQAGTNTRAGGSITFTQAACRVGAMFKLPLQAGDRGVRAVSTVNVGTAASAGACNVVLLREIAHLPITTAATLNARDFLLQVQSYRQIYDGASIGLAFLTTTDNTALTTFGALRAPYG